MLLLAFHLSLAVTLFLMVNWLGSHAKPFGYHSLSLLDRVEDAPVFNVLYRVIAPQVFLILSAATLSGFGQPQLLISLWRVTPLYFGVRWGFNILMGRAGLVAWRTQVPLAAVTSGISLGLGHYVLQHPGLLLPSPQDIATEMWLVVLVFIYATINRIEIPGDFQKRRQARFLTARYASLKGRYHGIVKEATSDPFVEALIYAVMIYEDYNRPAVLRAIESHLLFPLGKAKTLGPMQVRTTERIDDRESVARGAGLIVRLYPEAVDAVANVYKQHYPSSTMTEDVLSHWIGRKAVADKVASKYNAPGPYADEVSALYERVVERFYPEAKAAFES